MKKKAPNRINSTLEQLIEKGGRQILDSLMNIILANHAAKDSNVAKLDVEWRLLSGKMNNLVKYLSQVQRQTYTIKNLEDKNPQPLDISKHFTFVLRICLMKWKLNICL